MKVIRTEKIQDQGLQGEQRIKMKGKRRQECD